MNVYDTFSEWLYVEGKRPQTITTYQTDVRLFYEAIRGEVPKRHLVVSNGYATYTRYSNSIRSPRLIRRLTV